MSRGTTWLQIQASRSLQVLLWDCISPFMLLPDRETPSMAYSMEIPNWALYHVPHESADSSAPRIADERVGRRLAFVKACMAPNFI